MFVYMCLHRLYGYFIKLHVTAQPGPGIRVSRFDLQCSSRGRSMILNMKTSAHTRKREHTPYSSYSSPEAPCTSSLFVHFLFIDVQRQHLLNQHSPVYVLAPSSRVSPAFYITSNTLLEFLALLCPSSALLDHVPHLPSVGSGPSHNTTVSLGRRILRLRLLVSRWRLPRSHVLHPVSTSPG